MKKYSAIILSSLFTLSLLGTTPVFAATDNTTVMSETKQQVATDAMEKKEGSEVIQKVEYALPYPGILSDHPLYFLKKIRDQILERLISDPARKTEFYVLQSDKELNAAVFLEAKGKQSLVPGILKKSETYMEQAIKSVKDYPSQGKEVPGYLVEKVNNAVLKHIEVLNELLLKAPDAEKQSLSGAIESMKKLEQELSTIK
jgi:hypothetical protein